MIHGFAVDLFACFIVYTQFHVFLNPFLAHFDSKNRI